VSGIGVSNKQKSVRWTGIIWQLIHLGGGGLLLIILWAILGRYWSVEGFGQFNYIFAYISLAGIFIDFGLDVLLTRHIAGSNGNIPSNYWRLKFLCSLVFISFFFIFGLYLTIPLFVLLSLLVGSLALSFTAFLNALIRARDKLDIEAKIGIFQKASFILISIYGVSFLHKQMLWVALCYAISHILALGITLISIKYNHLKRPKNSEKNSSIKTLFQTTFPLFLIALLSVLTLRIDIFLLQAVLDEKAVGIYTAAMRLVEGCIVLGSAYQAAVFPKLVSLIGSADKFKVLFLKAIGHLLVGALIIVIPGIILSPWIIELLYGHAFEQSSQILIALLPVIILVYQTTLFGSIIIAMSRQSHYLIILTIALGLNGIIDYIAILNFGTIGAVIGFWAKEISLIIMLAIYLKKNYFPVEKKAA